MLSKKNTLAAFTMLELVFVIVILGIVSSIGAEIIAHTYESYIVQRAQYRASMKTELAINQIANRLRYAIPGTVMARATLTAPAIPINDVTSAADQVLQWVAYDGDSFEAISSSANTGTARRPGWSGFCDLAASTKSVIATPGSNLALTNEIIQKLSGGTKTLSDAVIYFPYDSTIAYGIQNGSGESITLDSNMTSGSKIYERYKLAWSSYALEVNAVSDLVLHYNFSPQYAAAINGNSSILLHNVTNFRFRGSEGSLRIKLCKEEKIGADANDTVRACKEKVVF